MSLISDALKRQEQLRAPGTGAAQPEVAVASPPEVAVASPPEVAVASPPEVAVASPPEVAAAAPPETSPRQRPNFAAPAAQLRPRRGPNLAAAGGATSRGVAAQNPFLERERAAARRPNHSALLMPVIGLLMLLVLLFLRREFVPQERTEEDLPRSPRKVEEPAPAPIVLSHDDPSRDEGRGNREEGTGSCRSADGPSASPKAVDEVRPSQTVDEEIELSDGAPAPSQREADGPSALRQSPNFAAPAAQPSNQATDKPTNRQTDKPATLLAEAQPQPTTWPSFTLTGIAVGRERLAILNTGEMLLAGETSKCGVKVEKVNAATVVFAWGGETKTLRKGEHSDKPAD